ncbi:hypothetical protein QJQ45_019156 [Haematococcus lacustris]|nr:hypothetical protein QJQ45_019156 [Haematococcus lacustris]
MAHQLTRLHSRLGGPPYPAPCSMLPRQACFDLRQRLDGKAVVVSGRALRHLTPIRAPISSATAGETATADAGSPAESYVVINLYHLVDVPNPEEVALQHKAYVKEHGLDVRGRIYYSHQGVNAQYGGPRDHALRCLAWLQAQPLWQGLRYSVWPSPGGHAFPRLRLQYKPNLISLAGGLQGLPVTQPEARATPLKPTQWKQMIAEAQVKLRGSWSPGVFEVVVVVVVAVVVVAVWQCSLALTPGRWWWAQEKKVVVLDVRNDYEWDAGHFVGAGRPDEEVFAETPVGSSEQDVPSPLRGMDPDTPVMMYCTGGIRCDIYSTFLKSRGFRNLFTLEGGVQHYLREEGGEHWQGSLYVFDARMAISPQGAKAVDGSGSLEAAALAGHPLPAAVPCQASASMRVCGCGEAQLPHVNCANVDCNELFIACRACKERFKGCCCEECISAPRLLRPALLQGGHYGAWGNYASEESYRHVNMTSRQREGRVQRRERRKEAMRAKRAAQLEQRQALKALMRDAMEQAEQAREQESVDTSRDAIRARLAQLLQKRASSTPAHSAQPNN